MINILGNTLLIIGMGFTILGSIFILIFPHFYDRLLACTYIDTIGMLFILLGVLFKYHTQTQPLKIILLILIALIVNPVSTYAIGRSAYLRGERPKKEDSHG